MTLDPNTAYLVAALVQIVVGVEQLVVWRTSRAERWTLCWGVGNLLGGIGSIGVKFIGLLPDYVAVSLSNSLALAGNMLLLQSVRIFAGRAPHWRVFALAYLLLAVPLLLSWEPDAFGWRIFYNNMVRATAALWIATTAVQLARRERLFTAWTMAALFGAMIPVSTTRAINAASGALVAGPLASGEGFIFVVAAVASTLMALQASTLTAVAAERAGRVLAALAHSDPLTGALNRAGLERFSARFEGAVALAVIDLDHFKALNDLAGHAAGDAALRTLGECGRAMLNARDKLVRLGGDEFLLVLPGRDAAAAAALVRTLGARFDATIGAVVGDHPPPTLSIGIAAGHVAEGALPTLMEEADAALYAAKQGGRNRVHVAQAAA